MPYKPFFDVNGGLRKSDLSQKNRSLAACKKDISKETTKSGD
jgi:hypothetical protein